MSRIGLTFILSLIVAATASCGGGTRIRETLTLGFPAIEQATFRSDQTMPVTHEVGDTMTGQISRMLLRFDISTLPPGAVIQSAILTVNQTSVTGTPWGDLGQIQIDHINIGADIDFPDWSSASLSGIIGVLTPASDAAPESKSANITSGLQTIVNGNFQLADFRLYFPIGTDGGNDPDRAEFGTGNNANLTVQYQLP